MRNIRRLVTGHDSNGKSIHAWSNRSDKVCRVAFILIDAAK